MAGEFPLDISWLKTIVLRLSNPKGTVNGEKGIG